MNKDQQRLLVYILVMIYFCVRFLSYPGHIYFFHFVIKKIVKSLKIVKKFRYKNLNKQQRAST